MKTEEEERMKPQKKKIMYQHNVMMIHTVLVVATIVMPLCLFLIRSITVKQCFALFGVGFFLISGHTFAFFNTYVQYMKKIEVLHAVGDATVRKMIRTSVILDMALAFFFYIVGTQ